MIDEQLEKVKSKIEKLLRLANNNPNVEEAAAAAKQAQRLMTKYAIEKATVQLDGDDMESDDPTSVVGSITVATGKRLANWRKFLANAIAKHNQCKAIIVNHGVRSELQFVGLGHDTSMCVALYSLLSPMIDRMARSYVKTRNAGRGKAKTIGNSYRLGAVHAINEKMNEGAKEARLDAIASNPLAERALARIEDVETKIMEYLGDVAVTKPKSPRMDANAWHQGHEDGQRIDLQTSKPTIGEQGSSE